MKIMKKKNPQKTMWRVSSKYPDWFNLLPTTRDELKLMTLFFDIIPNPHCYIIPILLMCSYLITLFCWSQNYHRTSWITTSYMQNFSPHQILMNMLKCVFQTHVTVNNVTRNSIATHCSYTRVTWFNTILKDKSWRNGWYLQMSLPVTKLNNFHFQVIK